MTISVVIPAYNEEQYLATTLEAVKKQIRKPDEILVIDGSSTDRTVAIAKKYGCRVLTVPKLTISFSRQQGLEKATGNIIAFTDADTLPPPNWLLQIEQEFISHPNVIGVFGIAKVTAGKFWYHVYMNVIQPYANEFWHLIGITMATGQNMSFYRLKALESGGFPVEYKICEDVEIARRLRKLGKTIFTRNICVLTSSRRGEEGWSILFRIFKVWTTYLLFHKADTIGFPDIR